MMHSVSPLKFADRDSELQSLRSDSDDSEVTVTVGGPGAGPPAGPLPCDGPELWRRPPGPSRRDLGRPAQRSRRAGGSVPGRLTEAQSAGPIHGPGPRPTLTQLEAIRPCCQCHSLTKLRGSPAARRRQAKRAAVPPGGTTQ